MHLRAAHDRRAAGSILPTPLRPSTARLPLRGHRQRDVVEHDGVAVAGAHAFKRQQRLSHGAPRRDRPRARAASAAISCGRALDQDAARHHDDDAAGEPEHDVHVVLDEQHGDVARQAGDGGEQLGALVARHAGGRLVQQQHLGLGGERQRDLQQPLLAVGELARQPGGSRRRATATRGWHTPRRPRRGRRCSRSRSCAATPAPLAHGQRHRLQRGQLGEQRVDLERAHQPALDPLVRA